MKPCVAAAAAVLELWILMPAIDARLRAGLVEPAMNQPAAASKLRLATRQAD